MTSTTTRGARLNVATLRHAGRRAGVTTWPVVLDVTPGDTDVESADGSAVLAEQELARLGLVDVDGEPPQWLATALWVLARPDRELEIRTFTAAGTMRAVLARRGHHHVFAEREGDAVALRPVDVPDTAEIGAIVRRHCATTTAATTFTTLAQPTAELADRLGRCRGADDIASVLHALGMSAADAASVGRALSHTVRRTEIVAVSREGATLSQAPGAVGIFDSDRGCVVASPSRAPDGRVWTTLSPGTGHRIEQATGLLVGTLPEGWWR
ncbi:ESX secretion-associated protein EspG [Gordonia sp. NPDC003429]